MPGELFTKASGWQRPGLANVDDYLPWLLGTVESIAEQRSWLSVAFLMLQITADLGVEFYRYFEFTVTSTVFCEQYAATGLLARCAYSLQKEAFKSTSCFDTADQRAGFKVSARLLGNLNVASTGGQN